MLLTGGWYSPYVVRQLLGHGHGPRVARRASGSSTSRSPSPWCWPGSPGGGAVAASAARLSRPTRRYLLACAAGLFLAALAGRLHDGGYVNVAIPAHVGMALLLGRGWSQRCSRHPATSARLLVGAGRRSWRAGRRDVGLAPDVVPTAADRAAGDAFVALSPTLPGQVLVPSHPYYLRLAGLPTHASAHRDGRPAGHEARPGARRARGAAAVVARRVSTRSCSTRPPTPRVRPRARARLHPRHLGRVPGRGLRAGHRRAHQARPLLYVRTSELTPVETIRTAPRDRRHPPRARRGSGRCPWCSTRMPDGYRPIVVDNGSTDGSGAGRPRPRGAWSSTEPRRGFGAACWAGLLAATSDVVAFMDADASLDPARAAAVCGPVVAGERRPRARCASRAERRLAVARPGRATASSPRRSGGAPACS